MDFWNFRKSSCTVAKQEDMFGKPGHMVTLSQTFFRWSYYSMSRFLWTRYWTKWYHHLCSMSSYGIPHSRDEDVMLLSRCWSQDNIIYHHRLLFDDPVSVVLCLYLWSDTSSISNISWYALYLLYAISYLTNDLYIQEKMPVVVYRRDCIVIWAVLECCNCSLDTTVSFNTNGQNDSPGGIDSNRSD